MARGKSVGITRGEFRRAAGGYRRRWGVELCATNANGAVALGKVGSRDRGDACRRARAFAVAEALRWGSATVVEYPGRRLAWAVPLMHNEALLGGLVAVASERRVLGGWRFDARRACEDLRRLAERENLTNAALLQARREQYEREQKRGEAIQDAKTRYFHSIREVYLREEPALIAAVRRDDRPEARNILNRILVEIYHLGRDDANLIKSFLMELVVTMCRTAVECGGDPHELLGANFASLGELAGISTEQELSGWLVQMLERIMDTIGRHRRQPSAALLHSAMTYLSEHLADPITRDEVARVAGLSPAYFSRVVRRHLGRTFNDLLNQLRADRAAELLRTTDRSLLQIALDVGFSDQSYFTKVFRRYHRVPPRQYRLGHRID